MLNSLTLSTIARCGEGRLVGADRSFDTLSTDTRTMPPGALFVALRGERFDGHDFAAAAAARGACGLLVDRPLPVDLPQVIVGDTLAALTSCARDRRRCFGGAVVGVTGSNGKTTSKEMIGAILGRLGPCLLTKGNLNNHIGVPLTLLALRDEHRSAVIEMGASHAGEIAHLTSVAEPTIGLVTNAGAAHLEGFGSLAGVATGKGELFAGLPPAGVAIVNADDAFAGLWHARAAGRRVVTFGIDAPADFSARAIDSSLGPEGPHLTFELVSPLGSARAQLALAGLHNLRNALGAAAASSAAGATLADIVGGLAAVRPVKGRLEFRPAVNGALLVDDSYNANPGSMVPARRIARAIGDGGDVDRQPHVGLPHLSEAGRQRLLVVEHRRHGGRLRHAVDDVLRRRAVGAAPVHDRCRVRQTGGGTALLRIPDVHGVVLDTESRGTAAGARPRPRRSCRACTWRRRCHRRRSSRARGPNRCSVFVTRPLPPVRPRAPPMRSGSSRARGPSSFSRE